MLKRKCPSLEQTRRFQSVDENILDDSRLHRRDHFQIGQPLPAAASAVATPDGEQDVRDVVAVFATAATSHARASANETEARFLWSQRFPQQPNSTVESNFADVRDYFYQGRKIDQQVHLGYDLAVAQHVAWWRRTTAEWCIRRRWGSTATASWWTTATASNPSMATSEGSRCTRATS